MSLRNRIIASSEARQFVTEFLAWVERYSRRKIEWRGAIVDMKTGAVLGEPEDRLAEVVDAFVRRHYVPVVCGVVSERRPGDRRCMKPKGHPMPHKYVKIIPAGAAK